jgi:2-amino-4-hydroxy-6-hydroxymethyldihydropteridine diphosphokinase
VGLMLVPAGIALGSNLGKSAAELDAGLAFLRSLAVDGLIRASPRIETDPVDCPPGSPPFLNAVAEINVDPSVLSPAGLLQRLQRFEEERGRPRRHARNAPRPLDLDLIYYGDFIMRTPELILPHPRAAIRDFVLRPLAHLRPDWILPGQTRTVSQLLEGLESGGAAPPEELTCGMASEVSLDEKTARLAYQIYEDEGRPEGRALDHWLQAQKQLQDDAFLEQELRTEEAEGGLVPKP